MNFIEFQLRAWRADRRQVQVLVHSSPVGSMTRPVNVPCNEKWPENVRELIEDSYFGSPGTLQRVVKAGQQLSKVLLPPDVATLLRRSLDCLKPDEGLRLRLCLDAELIDLPWEFMRWPDEEDRGALNGFLVLEPRLSLVRQSPLEALRVQAPESRQRMVMVGAQAGGADPYEVLDERTKLIEALRPVREFLAIDEEFANASGGNIENALAKPAAIFHYSGHVGTYEGRGFLVRAADEATQYTMPPTPKCEPLYSDARLGGWLRKAETRLAVFSACYSGRWSFVEPLLDAGLPVLIGVHGATWSKTAIAFCQKLYQTLAVGLSLDEAVIHARLHLLEVDGPDGSDSCEWGIYMVYMQTRDAALLPKPKSPSGVEKRREARGDIVHLQSKQTLRRAMMGVFDLEGLKILCSDIAEDLKRAGYEEYFDLETVGGNGKEAKIHNLIDHLDRRKCLPFLVTAVRKERPNIALMGGG